MEFITIKNSKIDIEDFSPMNVVFSVVVNGEKLLLVKNKESNFFELPVTEIKTFVDNKQKMIEINNIITNEYELNIYDNELIGICRIRFENRDYDEFFGVNLIRVTEDCDPTNNEGINWYVQGEKWLNPICRTSQMIMDFYWRLMV